MDFVLPSSVSHPFVFPTNHLQKPQERALSELPATLCSRKLLKTLNAARMFTCEQMLAQTSCPGISLAQFSTLQYKTRVFLQGQNNASTPVSSPAGMSNAKMDSFYLITQAHSWYGKRLHYLKRYKYKNKKGVVVLKRELHRARVGSLVMNACGVYLLLCDKQNQTLTQQPPLFLASLHKRWHACEIVSEDERDIEDVKEHEPDRLGPLKLLETPSTLSLEQYQHLREHLRFTNDLLRLRGG